MITPSNHRHSQPAPAHRSAGQGAPGRGWVGRLQTPALVRVALAWLLLALVMVPTLGRLHQVAHGGALDRVHAGLVSAHGLQSWTVVLAPALRASPTGASGAPTADSAVPVAAHSHGLLSLLLGQHAPVDCLLLDQLALGDSLHSAVLALPEAAPAHAPPADPALRTAASHVALFQARGPPRA